MEQNSYHPILPPYLQCGTQFHMVVFRFENLKLNNFKK